MSRPMYERDKDRYFEDKVKEFIEKVTPVTLHKLPIKYGADFLSVDRETGRPKSVIECKCRRNMMSSSYPDYRISLHKALTCIQYADVMDAQFLLVVGFADRVAVAELNIIDLSNVMVFGRTDRDDGDDIEPCVVLPMNKFKWTLSHMPQDFYVPIVEQ